MPTSSKPVKSGIAVIGMGRWGSSLYAALAASGFASVDAVGRIGRRASRGGPAIVSLTQASLDAELVWLCVPDGEISALVGAIVQKRGSLRGQIVVHSSGVYSSAILSEAARAGAKAASMHPLMTFPTRKPVALAGVPFAIEASGPLAVRLEKLVRQVGGVPFQVPAAGKALYHAAAVMASPLLVSLATAAQQTAIAAGLNAEQAKALLAPIMMSTLSNFFRDGAAKSFSGPFARGDAKTVSLHLEALQAHPFQQAVYRALAEHAIATLPALNSGELRQALAGAKRNILTEVKRPKKRISRKTGARG